MLERAAVAAMGTRFEVVLEGDAVATEAAIECIVDWESRLNRFDDGSFLSYLNREAGRHAVPVDDEIYELLETCAIIHRDSDGAFDVSVGAAMDAMGFHDVHDDEAASPRDDGPIGYDDVVLDPAERTVRFRRPGLQLDLGAIGKGHAIDDAARVLRDAGIERALLHGGTSTVLAIGAPPAADGWTVAIGDGPDAMRLTLRDQAMSVSEPTGRLVVRDGTRHGHVIDPRTGQSARAVRRAVVRGVSARATDAWATTLVVTGDRPPAMPAGLEAWIEGAGDQRLSAAG